MDSYLAIAEKVLETFQVPMKGQEILARAYLNDLVPTRLHGKTQHKTLQARLSEDIRLWNEKSIFCRTKPGVFFLRKFLKDETKEEFRARPRVRELRNKPILTVPTKYVEKIIHCDNTISIADMHTCFSTEHARYMNYDEALASMNKIVWSFVVVFRDYEILSFRQGRYREGRDEFVNQKAIGFASLPNQYDRTLFAADDCGLISSGICAAAIDMDMPPTVLGEKELQSRSKLEFYIAFENAVVGIVTFNCPPSFEPLKRRLAINELRWMDVRNTPNHMDDFDPWSRQLFSRVKSVIEQRYAAKAR